MSFGAKLATALATALMRAGSRNGRFGSQECYTPEFVRAAEGQVSIATRQEFEDGHSFFEPFGDHLKPSDLTGTRILDLGCGHAGRTVYYTIHGKPESITGLEINVERVSVGRDSAAILSQRSAPRGATNNAMRFVCGFGEQLPFTADSFDLIISYDVFEHVADLPAVLAECHRVLRPGGKLLALFPPYYGPRAHHLDFVTTLPFLHYVFSPAALVQAANTILHEQPGLRDEPLPVPRKSYLNRTVLPRLNGTTEKDFRRILAATPFKAEWIELVPFAWRPGGAVKRAVYEFCRLMLKRNWPFTRDCFVSTICSVLKKDAG